MSFSLASAGFPNVRLEERTALVLRMGVIVISNGQQLTRIHGPFLPSC